MASQAPPLRTPLSLLTTRAAAEGCLGGKGKGRGLPQSQPCWPCHSPAPDLMALTSLALPIGIGLWLPQNGKDLILQGVSDAQQPLLEGSIEGGPHCAQQTPPKSLLRAQLPHWGKQTQQTLQEVGGWLPPIKARGVGAPSSDTLSTCTSSIQTSASLRGSHICFHFSVPELSTSFTFIDS